MELVLKKKPTTRPTRRTARTRNSLAESARRRDFAKTSEPSGDAKGRTRGGAGLFVVQQHAARRLHYDFRLQLDGVLKSWAVPKGPSLDPAARRMAVEVEDHPLDYADFEGVIPKGEYGGGTVVVWDTGTWKAIGDPHVGLAKGRLEFQLVGQKLRGRWHLVRMQSRPSDRGKRSWLLIKGRDAAARPGDDAEITDRARKSVLSGRELDAVARAADRVWSAKPKRADARPKHVSSRTKLELPRAHLPGRVEPQLATLVDAPPNGAEWLHELKLDGYRIWARIEGGTVHLLTRAGNDWAPRFPALAEMLARTPNESALIDGEVVALDAQGRSHFQLLQNALKSSRPNLHFYAFDLLHLDGIDLRGAPLAARKEALRKLLGRQRAKAVHYNDHVGDGAGLYAEVCKSGGEGIVSKLANAPYQAGRTRAWLKVKCIQRQEFVVVGYTEPVGSRVGFGALLLGVYDDAGGLRYAGKVGTGFSGAVLASLRKQLAKLERERSSVVDSSRAERRAHWVEPRLVAEVAFTEWTSDGKIRHPAFVALRRDKPATAIRREIAAPVETVAPAVAERPEVAGVRLSNPGRVYFPDLGVTKSELAQYYEMMAERALPGLALRPLTLLRCPNGCDKECFYQKHATQSIPDRVGRVTINKGEVPYTMVKDLAGIVSLAQIAVIEFHVWGARADRIERPDLMVFDLDPDPSVPWHRLADTAQVLRSFLTDLGFVPFLRTTGGKGLHVVVPLIRRSSWDDVKSFTHAVALRLVREAPDQFTTQLSKSKRGGKILIDYLRNQRDATAIASYSVRARPGAPVAMPLEWSEIQSVQTAPSWNVRDAIQRLSVSDPWREFEASRRALTVKIRSRVGI